MRKNKFYIKETRYKRIATPYATLLGQITKKEADEIDKDLISSDSHCLYSYDTEQEYLQAIDKFKESGYNVS